MILAAICGTLAGEYNYQVNMLPYFDVAMLQTYLDVDPASARGEHLMDAGRIVFSEGSHLDLQHSMGFMDTETWCVAPVTTRNLDGNSTMPAVVDFWAIGKNCCTGSTGGDFRCGSLLTQICLQLLRSDMRDAV
ncbi:VIII-A [Symbiodinium pilosum]|uniref:VIII-A protein n=1 Tax=Symbiodinium pilosum TaxID=2952 RepID=A0A812WLM3_SYMPI|nr:VIII-A [Symbiodinium pilosum]